MSPDGDALRGRLLSVCVQDAPAGGTEASGDTHPKATEAVLGGATAPRESSTCVTAKMLDAHLKSGL